MTISELITDGYTAANECLRTSNYGGEYYFGEKYAKWLALATRFQETNYPHADDTARFSELARNANGNGCEIFHALIGILEAYEKIPSVPARQDLVPVLSHVFRNFERFDRQIAKRRDKRPTISIDDEYDVQDVLHAMLRLFSDDVRPEEYVPSYAGSNSRVDFLLPKEELIIEAKMTRKGLADKELGEQLIIDFNRYKELSKGNHMLCFVYDKAGCIQNPHGVITDLEKMSDDKLKITVIIAPT